MKKYFLSEDVFVCTVDNHCVFVDLIKDQYLCLETEKTDVFESMFTAGNKDIDTTCQEELAQELVDRKLITQHPNGRDQLTPPAVKRPTRDLIGYDIGQKPSIRIGHVLHFLSAATATTIRLRRQPLHRVISRVRQRKLKLSQPPHAQEVSFRQLKDLVEIYNRLRPLLFTAQNHCLYDALTLTEFLNKYRVYPDMIFGVKMGPFAAHCWVQLDDTVLNDSVALTLLQTPIMVA